MSLPALPGHQEIARERVRQQLPAGKSAVRIVGGAVAFAGATEGEGYYTTHDDQHRKKELARGAVDCLQSYLSGPTYVPHGDDQWGLGRKHNRDPRKLLVVAGALIAAEIDRLNRLAPKKAGQG